jgi:hypothetical protein
VGQFYDAGLLDELIIHIGSVTLGADESCGISEHYMDSPTQLCYTRVAPLAPLLHK